MPTHTKQIPLTPLDQKSFSGPIQMLKASVPYLNPLCAQKVAMLARILEVRSTMNIFNEEQLSICSLSETNKPNIEEILKDIRKYCAPSEAEQIDQFLNMFNALKLYNQYNDLFKNNDFSNMMNQFSSMNNRSSMNSMNAQKNSGMNITPEHIQILQNLLHAQSGSSTQDSANNGT